ncbi:unnamed protein product [Blepharisma stoltei]|uniref:Uncharacterized protein n=1 Tax=Blepharisma stoltei TaxID=1481888 RepID=A0AAU9JL89_9CILI|nr:unnamed protein product [Blepharisma stoltei]
MYDFWSFYTCLNEKKLSRETWTRLRPLGKNQEKLKRRKFQLILTKIMKKSLKKKYFKPKDSSNKNLSAKIQMQINIFISYQNENWETNQIELWKQFIWWWIWCFYNKNYIWSMKNR